jgi:ATP adenylyltransferase
VRQLWAPWRMQYVASPAAAGCFFCAALASDDAPAHLVLAREPHAVTLLNKYPYAHGHLLVAPRRHVAHPEALADAEYDALMRAVRSAARVLEQALRPEGMNIGVNLGRAAGAGVADHCHWHLVPRWIGDVNFMPLVGEVKVLSEHLRTTWERLHPLFG